MEQRAGKRLYLKEAANRIHKRLLAEFECVGLGKLPAELIDFVLQFQPLCLVFLRHVHEPLFRNLVFRVILIEPFAQAGDSLVSCSSLGALFRGCRKVFHALCCIEERVSAV